LGFRLVGKIALFLVVFGFFMPMACRMKGFDIANEMIDNSNYSTMAGFLLFLSFFSALAGVIVAVLLFLNKDVPIIIDRIVVFTCVISGVVAFFNITGFQIKSGSDLFKEDGIYIMLASGHYAKLQSGSYIIFIGLVLSFIAEISYSVNKSSIGNRSGTDDFKENIENTIIEQYKTNREIDLFNKPNLTSGVMINIQQNEIVTLIKIGEKINENNYWYYIKHYKEKNHIFLGWCYSEYLEKI